MSWSLKSSLDGEILLYLVTLPRSENQVDELEQKSQTALFKISDVMKIKLPQLRN